MNGKTKASNSNSVSVKSDTTSEAALLTSTVQKGHRCRKTCETKHLTMMTFRSGFAHAPAQPIIHKGGAANTELFPETASFNTYGAAQANGQPEQEQE